MTVLAFFGGVAVGVIMALCVIYAIMDDVFNN